MLGATNRPFDIDPAVLRRMPCQIEVPLPDTAGRASILRCLLRTELVEPGADLSLVAEQTSDFSGSDLREVVRQAAWAPVREAAEGGGAVRAISTDDLLLAAHGSRPSGAAAAAYGERLGERVSF